MRKHPVEWKAFFEIEFTLLVPVKDYFCQRRIHAHDRQLARTKIDVAAREARKVILKNSPHDSVNAIEIIGINLRFKHLICSPTGRHERPICKSSRTTDY